jgi:co-chaperonin GroES (HSP10)
MPDIGENGLTQAEAVDVAARLLAQEFLLLDDRIAVIRDPEEQEKNGIIIPEQSRNKPIRGTVVMVGDLVQHDIEVGDRVAFTKYRPTRFQLPLIEGEAQVEVMHVADVYIRWGRK